MVKTNTKINHGKIKRNKTMKIQRMKGGNILKNAALKKIISIGYEFECGDMFVTHLDEENDNFLIPQEKDVELLLHDKSCFHIGDYTCILSSETDTPNSLNITHSLLDSFEQLLIRNEKKFKNLLKKSKFLVKGEEVERLLPNLPITHTEFLFTIFHKDNPCDSPTEIPLNDADCIMNTFKMVLSMMDVYFLPAVNLFPKEDVPNEIVYKDKVISYYQPNPDFNIRKPLYYGIFSENTETFTPQTIKWVPQMTYCVAVEDIISVTIQLAQYLHKEETDIIAECIRYTEQLMKHVNNRNPLKSTFKNMLFFAIYYYHTYYFFTQMRLKPYEAIVKDKEGNDKTIQKIDKLKKNMYCFLFRHSILEMIKHYWTIDATSVIQIQKALEKNILISGVVDDEIVLETDSAEIQINKLLSYVSRNFYFTVEDLQNENVQEYPIFSKIFQSESNYYPFNGEHVLIEYRCFARNLIKSINSADRKKKDSEISIHRTLEEWRELIGM